jgi:L-threonylcarbamoyladenylate synthase
VYGLAADARNASAIAKLYALKGRPDNHPVIVHIAQAEQMRAWAHNIPDIAWQLARRFWPGPMTLILDKLPGVLAAITGGQDSVGLRVPSHPQAQTLLTAFGDGLAAPSANRFGRISPTTAQHVRDEFGVELPIILDGGASAVGIESSIIDVRGAALRILRPGAITAAMLNDVAVANHAVANHAVASDAASTPISDADIARVPGALASHYAPRTPARLVTRAQCAAAQADELVLCLDTLPAGVAGIALASQPAPYASALYGAMRALDARGARQLFIERPPNAPSWLAVLDRITRACAN